MQTCPSCQTGWYSTYANGTSKVGYCQHCGLETKVETKEKDLVPMIYIEKPQSKSPPKIRRTK